MKTVPEITEAEIQEMMDFQVVLALTEEAQRRNRKIARRILTTVLITGLVGASWFAYERYSVSESDSSTTSQVPSDNLPPAKVQPSIVPSDTAQQSVSPGRTGVAKKKPDQKSLLEENIKPIDGKKEETSAAIVVDSAKSVSVFLPAEPIDGYPALYEYFARELRYPEQAIKDSIQGVTLVTFIINTQGAPEQVATDHLLGEAFEKEAIRLIEHMPAWKPAQLNGSPVRSKLSVPITFKVQTFKKP